ncbi:LETM1 and EF-hand domain-containing protein anon-60Da, mitochondrial [Senna tora]|uniref:LETM1 and EF-hand domain-containing protein anon-60Da, mitochondrial n=1 Tax=Senna tora TaxID=362788 RepID=A0A834TAZ7_9FABA|nr:LETM1 and EF-hand domain-containing protein anon-60Da, mitochondrial [Senna tora]
MAIKLHHNSFLSLSSSDPRLSQNQCDSPCLGKKASDWHLLLSKWGSSRKRCLIRHALLSNNDCGLAGHRKHHLTFSKPRRRVYLFPFASADDGVTVNGSPQAKTSTDLEKMRVKLNKSLEDEDFCDGLLQSLYDATRVFELAIKEQSLHSRASWFSTAWLGIDQNAWAKELSYQAAVYSLLQAASEISSRSDCGDRNVNELVQRSLLRLSAPLESLIREKLSAKKPEAYEWFWSDQVPAVVTSFINKFEGSTCFTASTSLSGKNMSLGLSSGRDVSLLMLSLTCIAAIIRLGPTKVSCSQFFSMITEITGSLMDTLVDLIPISQAYNSIKELGLRREFLVHFGPRAAACRAKVEWGSEEVAFWVNLAQRQLQQAIDKEKIWSRLTTSESIEVLEKDLAIFGFFIALGRSTRSFLSANGFDALDDSVEDFIRYLIGGSVLYYPQLSSISSYQLYVEVVCEELDWLPFYPGNNSTTKQLHGHKGKAEGPPNAEAVSQALDVCSHWMQSFIKYSTWLERPSNVKAARFLSIGDKTREIDSKKTVERNRSAVHSTSKESASFDEALESVEEAMLRLEKLLQELHVSSANSGKEHLKAACSDLEKIRKLKKEAEFLEASFRAKADSLQQGVNDDQSQTPDDEVQEFKKGQNRKNANVRVDRSKRNVSKPRGFWSLFVNPVTRKPDMVSDRDAFENYIEQPTSNVGVVDLESSEIRRFELLRNELIELEKRVERSARQSENDDLVILEDGAYGNDSGGVKMVQVQKKGNIIESSIGKLKETGTDVWQGTQLLAFDVAAAMGLIRRALIGDELTEKEKKTLKRTLTDMASVIPIGVLMLLPVTAVGHAAMLAAIQRYVPALIPSTYAPERLDLLRQLEKVKEMTTTDVDSDEEVDEVNS